MKQFTINARRSTLAFAMLFALVSLHPFTLTGLAQKGRAPINRTPDEAERQAKIEFQRSNPKRSPAPVQGVANGPVSTNATGNTTYSITFDAGDAIGGLPVSAVLTNQYTAVTGATFSANAFSGAGGPTGAWATNTDTTVVDSAGGDVGGLGAPTLVSGNLLRSFNGWLGENGDGSIRVTFAIPVSTFSATFAGIATAASSRLQAFDSGNNLLATGTAAGNGQQVVTVSSGTPIASVAILPGDFNDWVGVDNITFTTINVGGPQSVDSQVDFVVTQQNLGGVAPAGCTGLGYNATQYNLNVTLTNIGTNTFTNPFYRVVELQAAGGVAPVLPFRLRTADDFVAGGCTGGLVNSTQAITASMPPQNAQATNFQIVLPAVRRFRFIVSVFATIGSVGNNRTERTVKIGNIAMEATGFDAAGNPILTSVFTPEKGFGNSVRVNAVNATLARK